MKIIFMAFFPIFCHAQDIYLECKIYPAAAKNIREEEKLKTIFLIKSDRKSIKYKNSESTFPLTTTEEKYSWSVTIPPTEGQRLVISENIDRVDGTYQSVVVGPKGIMPFSLGNCIRLESRL